MQPGGLALLEGAPDVHERLGAWPPRRRRGPRRTRPLGAPPPAGPPGSGVRRHTQVARSGRGVSPGGVSGAPPLLDGAGAVDSVAAVGLRTSWGAGCGAGAFAAAVFLATALLAVAFFVVALAAAFFAAAFLTAAFLAAAVLRSAARSVASARRAWSAASLAALALARSSARFFGPAAFFFAAAALARSAAACARAWAASSASASRSRRAARPHAPWPGGPRALRLGDGLRGGLAHRLVGPLTLLGRGEVAWPERRPVGSPR